MMKNIFSAIENLVINNRRTLIAIAGPPAAGKSTVSEELITYFGSTATILPMDGFHLDNQILMNRGILQRKGSPESFDFNGFLNMIKRIKAGENVIAPKFDRGMDLSVAGAIEIRDQNLIIIEGNYLLFNEQPWISLQDYWSFAIWLEVKESILKSRLIQRWIDYGYDKQGAQERAVSNDLPNMKRVIDSKFINKNLASITVTNG